MNLLKYVITDLFDLKIIKYSLFPLLISIVFWGIVFYFFSTDIVGFIHYYVSYLPFANTVNNILTNIGSTIVLIFLYYEMVILSMGIFIAFFVDKITGRINEKYYHLGIRKISLSEGILVSVKGFIYFLLFFILTFYLFFIPVINIFYQVFLWSLAIKKSLVFDSTALFCDYKTFEKKQNLKIWTLVFITSFVYFLPVISLFGYVFQLIIMTHFVLSQCLKKK